jgi:predicted CopG family antitoxin
MGKKLTISLDEKVYYELCRIIGKRKISQFVEDLLKSHVIYRDLDEAYKEMAADKSREEEALDCSLLF